MAKQYTITDVEMKALRERLELQYLRDNNISKADDAESIWRGFNFVVCRWMQEVGVDRL